MSFTLEEIPMRWKKPVVTEIALGMEINCYACADV
ncbi:pyrroloquinoline quinone precursor peptide PqqA [Nitrospirillum sp. BR 11828]|nr:pyrroloquinoline quinone precursor peptide PqqA [Nitrospirillum sp. BR 11828]MDZ5645915.1 pyrroloquinoline quinone precursor peptide PqqA [Nitrospirillum sp. BR 11828]